MMLASLALLVAAAAASPTPAPSPAPTPVAWVEAGGSLASLTDDRGTWQSEYLSAGTKRGRREFDATFLQTRRFGFSDSQVALGAYWPSSTQTTAHLEVDLSPTHRILPQLGLYASLEHRLDGGWGYILGAGTRSYTGLGVQTQSLVVDRYWKNYRVAYTLGGAELSNVPGIALDHALSLTHYYDADQSSAVTLSAALGRDVENDGTGLLVLPTLELTASGRHRFGRNALVWSLTSAREGSLYRRTGVDLGLRRTF